MRRLARILFTVCALGAMGAAQAIQVNIDFTGSVDFADEGNVFGLDVGDTITGSAFVPNAIGEGFEIFTPAEGLEVFFTVGSFIFTTEDDVAYPFLPELWLNDADLEYLGFVPMDDFFFPTAIFTTGLFPNWFGFGVDGPGAGGTLTYTVTVTTDTVSVPEPATLALFGLGLLGLWLASRKYSRLPRAARQS